MVSSYNDTRVKSTMSVRFSTGNRNKVDPAEESLLPAKSDASGIARGFAKATWRSRALQICHTIKSISTNRQVWVCVSVVVVSLLYYAFLGSLYIVDEVYEANSLRELVIEEKFTIRVIAPRKEEHLQSFISKYSICQSVEEIQVVWGHTQEPPPSASSFTYSKTHCPVVFDILDSESEWPPVHYGSKNLAVRTEGVLLLESDVLMECDDLKFVHSVWRSGRETLVGVLPRVHMKWNNAQYTYHGWNRVWWNGFYSLMLSGAVMTHNDILQSTKSSEPLNMLLSKHPECYNVGLSVWSSSTKKLPLKSEALGVQKNPEDGAKIRPVVWAQVPVSRKNLGGAAESAHVDNMSLTMAKSRVDKHGGERYATTCECLTMLAASLSIQDLPYSSFKAVVAKNKLWW